MHQLALPERALDFRDALSDLIALVLVAYECRLEQGVVSCHGRGLSEVS